MAGNKQAVAADFSKLEGKTIRVLDFNATKTVEEFTGEVLSVFFSPYDNCLHFILLCHGDEKVFLKDYRWDGVEKITVINLSLSTTPGY